MITMLLGAAVAIASIVAVFLARERTALARRIEVADKAALAASEATRRTLEEAGRFLQIEIGRREEVIRVLKSEIEQLEQDSAACRDPDVLRARLRRLFSSETIDGLREADSSAVPDRVPAAPGRR